MQLLELALQGIKGFPAQARIALGSGYAVLRAPATAQLEPVLAALLFDPGTPSAETARLEAPGAAAVRASLTFKARDGFTYRMVRDLRGPSVLHRLEGETNKFVPFSQDAGEIAAYLKAHSGLPPRRLYEELFTVAEDRLPTVRFQGDPGPPGATVVVQVDPEGRPLSKMAQKLAEKAAAKAGGAALRDTPGPKATFRGYAGPDPTATAVTTNLIVDTGGLTPEQIQANIAKLSEELRGLRATEDAQFAMDGLNGALSSAEEKLGSEKKILEEIAAAEREVVELRKLPIPINLRGRLEAIAESEKRRDEALARVEAERQALDERAAAANPIPVKTDRRFWAGVGVGSAALLAGVLSPVKSLALLDIPALGASAFLALRYVTELQSRDGLSRKRTLLEERDKKAYDEHEAGSVDVRRSMKALGVDSISELESRAAEREEASDKVTALQQRLAALRADPGFQEAFRERDRLLVEISQLETSSGAGAGEPGAYVRSSSEVERELDRYRSMLQASTHAAPAQAAAPEGARGPLRDDASARLLERAAELFAVDRGELPRIMQERAGQYLMALTDRRWQTVEIAGAGGVSCSGQPGRKAFSELPGRDADVAYLALQLTVIERYVGRFPVPVIFDDPFSFLPPARQALVAKMLKALGARTQVLHRTTSAPLTEGADSVVEIK